jgi:hypothetical protein
LSIKRITAWFVMNREKNRLIGLLAAIRDKRLHARYKCQLIKGDGGREYQLMHPKRTYRVPKFIWERL